MVGLMGEISSAGDIHLSTMSSLIVSASGLFLLPQLVVLTCMRCVDPCFLGFCVVTEL